MIVLSHYTVAPLLAGRKAHQETVTASLDLGLTECQVVLEEEGVLLPDGQRLAWSAVEEIAGSETACFLIEGGDARKIQFFSEARQRFYSLLPTRRAPTMLLASFPMHRIKEIDPHEDTLRKMKTIAPVVGRVLDTCTGLGYTAIQSARTAEEVVTIELDPMVLEVCRRNPWSQPLFDSPRIRQLVGSAYDQVAEMGEESFSRIFHDPPTFKIAGELYSGEMYRRLHRVLRRGGRMYHYIGDLESAHGRSVLKGVVRRLQDAGFARVERRPEAFGVTAYK